MGYAANKIGSAVQWIDNPFHITVGVTADATLFTEEAMVWVSLGDMINNRLFGASINFSDKVVATFLVDLYQVEVVGRLQSFRPHYAQHAGQY